METVLGQIDVKHPKSELSIHFQAWILKQFTQTRDQGFRKKTAWIGVC